MEAVAPVLTLYFEFVNKIGEGGNSTVWSIKDKDGKLFACKIPDEGTEEMIINEASTMSRISKYPNKSPFLTFYGVYSYGNKPVAVYELFDGQVLSNLIGHKLNEAQLLNIAKQLFEQVAYLNNLGTCHGDI